METVNVKIKSLNGLFSATGVYLMPGDELKAPKLRPHEIIAIPKNHPIFTKDAARHLEITSEEPTRPLMFPTVLAAKASYMTPEQAEEAGYQIEESLKISSNIRDNSSDFDLIDQAKAEAEKIIAEAHQKANDIIMATAGVDNVKNVESDNAHIREVEKGTVGKPAPKTRSRK